KLDFLTFSAALGNMSKLYCTRLHENCTHLAQSLHKIGCGSAIQVNLIALTLHNLYIRLAAVRQFK
ncbi:MAG: hypothetical protein MR971_01315, partial [Bacteroidales bacterium]|nr:hypothetical protein [Bacteroidales bacterium]